MRGWTWRIREERSWHGEGYSETSRWTKRSVTAPNDEQRRDEPRIRREALLVAHEQIAYQEVIWCLPNMDYLYAFKGSPKSRHMIRRMLPSNLTYNETPINQLTLQLPNCSNHHLVLAPNARPCLGMISNHLGPQPPLQARKTGEPLRRGITRQNHSVGELWTGGLWKMDWWHPGFLFSVR